MEPLNVLSNPGGCGECIHLAECGGLDGLDYGWGCFTECQSRCHSGDHDYTCMCKPGEFARRMVQVGGVIPYAPGPLRAINDELPLYMPTIQHGGRRQVPLSWPAVALPLGVVMARRRGGTYGLPFARPDALREHFMLAPGTKVLLLAVGHDKHLESYWRHRKPACAAQQIAGLGLVGASSPNFSFFTDAPKTEIIFNRRRSLMVADEWSRAGVGVALHLNALTQGDWYAWERLLRDRPHLRYVVKEFQTGLGRREPGVDAVVRLARLQDRLERPLHPILIGGGQYVGLAARYFERLTLVDSEPFMRAMNRRALVPKGDGRLRREKRQTGEGEPLDSLFLNNLEVYRAWVERQVAAKSFAARKAGHMATSRGERAVAAPDGGQRSFRFAADAVPVG